MRVLMLFLDGVGIGRDDPAVNPLAAARLPALRALFGGELPTLDRPALESAHSAVVPLDATLGVEGLPQSGTGQTALFTGENGARIIGKHFGPYPYSTLRPLIVERNIFRSLLAAGKRVRFANAFPQRFFDHLARRPTRVTVPTLAATASGVPLLRAGALGEGAGISGDITAEAWPALGHAEVQPVTPQEAGGRLARLLRTHDFVLFEYWLTDRAGHSQNLAEAVSALERIDGLVEGIVATIDPTEELLLISSDHGNVEDMTTKSHTRNPVPAIFHGAGAPAAAALLAHGGPNGADLTRVTPLLLHLLGASPRAATG